MHAFILQSSFVHKSALQGARRCERLRKNSLLRVPRRPRVVCLAPSAPNVQRLIDPALFSTAFGATAKLLTTVFFGFLASTKGVLNPAALKVLSRVVYTMFLPALLLTNVTTTIASGAGPQLLVLPIAALLMIIFGLLAGVMLARVLRLKPVEKRLFIVCCGFGNSAALPLLLAGSLFEAPAQLAGLTAGVSFYLLGWTGVFWSLGYHLLATIPSSNSSDGGDEKQGGFDVKTLLTRVFSPPLVASLVGIAVGCLPTPLRAVAMSSPVFAALRTLGQGYGPTAILVLAGSLAGRVPRESNANGETIRLMRVCTGIAVTRFMLMPCIGTALVRTGAFANPMAKLAVLLEASMPPAQNSTVILAMEGRSDLAAALARVLLIMYVVGTVPMCLLLSVFLGVAGI